MAAAFAASLSACSTAMGTMGTNFSGIPEPTSEKLAQYPADPPLQMHLNNVQISPYDSPDFVVPPYLIQP
jgi:hypothetical protein